MTLIIFLSLMLPQETHALIAPSYEQVQQIKYAAWVDTINREPELFALLPILAPCKMTEALPVVIERTKTLSLIYSLKLRKKLKEAGLEVIEDALNSPTRLGFYNEHLSSFSYGADRLLLLTKNMTEKERAPLCAKAQALFEQYKKKYLK